MKSLLYPFALVYGAAIRLRNYFYARGWRKSFEFDFPIINVGNLSVGGTGKTPHIEFLIDLCLQNDLKPAVLSRGYGRRTFGYRMAGEEDSAKTIGDEPAQIKHKFPGVPVVVCEKRARAVPQLLSEAPSTKVILLDDAFQHRAIKPGLNLLLTSYHKPFWKDKLLPVGRLREPRTEQRRADAVIVTKCNGAERSKLEVLGAMVGRPTEEVLCTRLSYGQPYHISKHGSPFEGWGTGNLDVLLLCGIADPGLLEVHLRSHVNSVQVLKFRDHHNYNQKDVARIGKVFNEMNSPNKVIVTTEKDATRLLVLDEDWDTWPMYVQPVQVEFVNGEPQFKDRVLNFVRSFNEANNE